MGWFLLYIRFYKSLSVSVVGPGRSWKWLLRLQVRSAVCACLGASGATQRGRRWAGWSCGWIRQVRGTKLRAFRCRQSGSTVWVRVGRRAQHGTFSDRTSMEPSFSVVLDGTETSCHRFVAHESFAHIPCTQPCRRLWQADNAAHLVCASLTCTRAYARLGASDAERSRPPTGPHIDLIFFLGEDGLVLSSPCNPTSLHPQPHLNPLFLLHEFALLPPQVAPAAFDSYASTRTCIGVGSTRRAVDEDHTR